MIKIDEGRKVFEIDGDANGVFYKSLGIKKALIVTDWEKYPFWHFNRWFRGETHNYDKITESVEIDVLRFYLWKTSSTGETCEGFCDIDYEMYKALIENGIKNEGEIIRDELCLTVRAIYDKYYERFDS